MAFGLNVCSHAVVVGRNDIYIYIYDTAQSTVRQWKQVELHDVKEYPLIAKTERHGRAPLFTAKYVSIRCVESRSYGEKGERGKEKTLWTLGGWKCKPTD